MSEKCKMPFLAVSSAAIVLIIYIFLHELGHAIVMLSAGATIMRFSILTAHVSAEGGSYTNLSDLWLHANGAFFPLLISFFYGLLYKKDSKSSFYHLFSFMAVLIPTSSMLAWVIMPFLYLRGNAPPGDDVTNFLYNFSQAHNPLVVSVSAVILMGANVAMMEKKRIICNFKNEIKANC